MLHCVDIQACFDHPTAVSTYISRTTFDARNDSGPKYNNDQSVLRRNPLLFTMKATLPKPFYTQTMNHITGLVDLAIRLLLHIVKSSGAPLLAHIARNRVVFGKAHPSPAPLSVVIGPPRLLNTRALPRRGPLCRGAARAAVWAVL